MHPFLGLASRHRSLLIAAAIVVTAVVMPLRSRDAPSLAAYVWTICAGAFHAPPPQEAPFLSENVAAMTTMMAGMAIKPTGDVDKDFVTMMAPHHQGAIDMAQAELRYGHNPVLARIAQEIIVTQQQEIAAMRLAVGETLPPSMPSPDQPDGAPQ
jgi:hypothetical protein